MIFPASGILGFKSRSSTCHPKRSASWQQGGAGVDGAYVGRRRTGQRTQFHHRATSASISIGLPCRHPAASRSVRPTFSAPAILRSILTLKGHAELLGDGLGLRHHLRCKFPCQQELTNVHQGCVGQCADRIELRLPHSFSQNLATDVVDDRRFEPSPRQLAQIACTRGVVDPSNRLA